MDHPLRPVVSAWVNKLKKAREFKKEKFQDDADEAMKFFNGPYDFLYGPDDSRRAFTYAGDQALPSPSHRMTVNKVAELVQIFGPALYHRNPVRQVNPRKLPQLPAELFGGLGGAPGMDPGMLMQQQMLLQQRLMMQAQQQAVDQSRAVLLETYLNYTPNALDLKTESRWAIDEAIIKGMGCLWTETYTPPGSQRRMVGSFFDSVDNLLIDPDMESLRDAKWVAKRCCHPHWEVEDEYGLERGALAASSSAESLGRQAEVAASATGDYDRKRGLTNDLVVYWKIYSKMGLGGRLSGVTPRIRDVSDAFGPYCYLVVCESLPYFLNVPPHLTAALAADDDGLSLAADQEVQRRLEWPTPHWADDNWPVTPILFHPVPKEVWPMSHVKPGMGELKAINWIWSMLVGKLRIASRDFVAILKSASEEVKNKITHGSDYTVIEVEAIHDSIDKMVKFLQHPEFNPEIYRVLQGLMDLFDKRTGLTELLYGLSASQMRSAEEAALKGEQVSVRPDDMANKVEEAMTALAAREAFAARWHLTGQDVAPVLGPEGAYFWDQLVAAADPEAILHGLEYRIEAGSARKPNRAREAANMQQALQSLLQPLFAYAGQSGDVQPVNALIAAWARSIDLEAGGFLLKPLPLPAPPTEQPPAASKGEPS